MTNYWLMKSEPGSYNINDLERDGVSGWEGVRNFQARNFMRDEMRVGDKVLFYHSNAKPSGVAGIAEVCSKSHADPTAFDRKSPYYEPKSTKKDPIWMMVDIKFIQKFPQVLSLEEIRKIPACKDMLLLKKGQRLSVQPVDKLHFQAIKKAALAD